MVVVCAGVGYMFKKWLRKREHERRVAADRGIAGNQVAQPETQPGMMMQSGMPQPVAQVYDAQGIPMGLPVA